jgi:DNA-binding IclR family transcriptional regulator
MDELDVLRVREDVLQALYWMHSEGLGEDADASELARFLGVPAGTLAPYLERFVGEGYLEERNGRFRLTPSGTEHGKRTFAEEFADLTRPAHGECDEDCWCHESPEEAARCLEERREQHVH